MGLERTGEKVRGEGKEWRKSFASPLSSPLAYGSPTF